MTANLLSTWSSRGWISEPEQDEIVKRLAREDKPSEGRRDLSHADLRCVLVARRPGDVAMCLSVASIEIEPTRQLCSKRCYASSWNAQTVPKQRVRATEARLTGVPLQMMRDQVARLVER